MRDLLGQWGKTLKELEERVQVSINSIQGVEEVSLKLGPALFRTGNCLLGFMVLQKLNQRYYILKPIRFSNN